MRRSTLKHVKTVHPKRGRDAYLYFDTGRKKPDGRPIHVALPAIDDPSFWPTYGSLVAARNRRDKPTAALSLTALIGLYRKSGKYRDLKPRSQKIYDIYLRQIDTAFPGAPADDVKRRDMQLLVDNRADKPGAANMIVRVGSALFDWAAWREYVPGNPCSGIDLNDLGEHAPWPQDLLDQGLTAGDPLVRLAVNLLYYSGQRIGDVTMMRWTDIRNGRIEIEQEKTGKPISIPVHPMLQAVLDETPRRALTILSRRGEPIDRDWLREESIQPWAAALGCKVVPHGIRKNTVNVLLEIGCSVAEVSSITGQTLAVVEHYAKRRDTRKLADSTVLRWGGTKS